MSVCTTLNVSVSEKCLCWQQSAKNVAEVHTMCSGVPRSYKPLITTLCVCVCALLSLVLVHAAAHSRDLLFSASLPSCHGLEERRERQSVRDTVM